MPRLGRHPLKVNKFLSIEKKILSIGTVVHIPNIEGYFEDSLKVLDLCIQSMHAHTDVDFDLHVFDNGSCKEVKEYLNKMYEEGFIHILTYSSKNLFKTGGLIRLLTQADNEYVAFTDSDVFFLPNWFNESKKIFDEFSDIGQVTSSPLASNKDKGFIYDKVLNDLSQDEKAEIIYGNNLIDENYVNAHAISLGEDPNKYKNTRLKNREDILIKRNDVEAFLISVDFQFITKKEIISKILPIELEDGDKIREDQIYRPIFEKKLDDLNYWRVSTPTYNVHHMGNKIPNLKIELPWINLDELSIVPDSIPKPKVLKRKNRLLNSTRLRRVVKKIHLWTYRFLYERN